MCIFCDIHQCIISEDFLYNMMTLSSQNFIIYVILLDKPRMDFGDWTLV